MSYYIITGATGLLGRYLLRDLLSRQIPLVVIARSNGPQSARQRIDSILTSWEKQLGYDLPRPVVFSGDLTQPDLGLTKDDLIWIRSNCRSAIHNAASLKFAGKNRDREPWRSNLNGTRNLLGLCKSTGITDFFHVSTAYVCGKRDGLILESELDVGQVLANDYEASKIAAEKLVLQSGHLEKVTVFRPSIIAGDSRTGFTSTYHGFYFPLKVSAALLPKLQSGKFSSEALLHSMGLSGAERKNVVPVDWVSSTIAKIIAQRSLPGKTYHLTSATPVTLSQIADSITYALTNNKEIDQFSARQQSLDFSAYQRQFWTAMESYKSYWRNDPQFCRTNTDQLGADATGPHVDSTMMNRWCRFAVANKFSEPTTKLTNDDLDIEKLIGPGNWSSRILASKKTVGASTIGIQVNGVGGGQWQVSWSNDEIIGIRRGIDSSCRTRLYLNSYTLRQIAGDPENCPAAIETGRMVVEGEINQPVQLMKQLFSRQIR